MRMDYYLTKRWHGHGLVMMDDVADVQRSTGGLVGGLAKQVIQRMREGSHSVAPFPCVGLLAELVNLSRSWS